MNHGFMKTAAAVPKIRVADVNRNKQEIISSIKEANSKNVQMLVFPSLVLSGSTCGHLFDFPTLSQNCIQALLEIAAQTRGTDLLCVIGLPVWHQNKSLSCVVLIKNGELLAAYAKDLSAAALKMGDDYLPLLPHGMFCYNNKTFGISFDISSIKPCDIAIILENKPTTYKEYRTLKVKLEGYTATWENAAIYVSNGIGESTGSAVYSGAALLYEMGNLLKESKRYQPESTITISDFNTNLLKNSINDSNIPDMGFTPFAQFPLDRVIFSHPFAVNTQEEYEEILDIQAAALCRRMEHISCKKLIMGISGGLDSTMVLVSAARTMDRLGYPKSNIIGVTMPGFGTTHRTKENARLLIQGFGASFMEIDITQICEKHFADIGHDKTVTDIVFENAQARERTQILLDLANKHHALMVGPGDLSEIALGFTTFGGDALAQYSINTSLPKTLMRDLLSYVAKITPNLQIKNIIMDVLDTPISPELLPADEKGNIQQKTEEKVGPYELHDFFIYYFVKHKLDKQTILFMAENAFSGIYEKHIIEKWLDTFIRRFFGNQFKRFGMCEGPAVTEVSLSPTDGFIMPGDANSDTFNR